MKISFPLTSTAAGRLSTPDQRVGYKAQQLEPSDEELAEIQRKRKEEEAELEKNKVKTKPSNKKEDASDESDINGGETGEDEDGDEDDGSSEDDTGEEGDEAGDESDEEEEEEDAEATASNVPGVRKIRRVATAADGGLNNVFSGFPGVGKSTAFKNYANLAISDSDSSTFDKAQFPGNYMTHIEKTRPSVDVLMVSSHNVVRDALVERNIPFHLVYPSADQKAEYMERYKQRGSPQPFLDLMDKNWDTFLSECAAQTGCEHIVLQPGQFLGDVIQDYL